MTLCQAVPVLHDLVVFYKMADCCRPEVVSDIISGGIKEDIEVNLCVNFGNPRSSGSFLRKIIFFQNGDCYQAEEDNDVIFGVNVGLGNLMMYIKFGDIVSSRFGEKSLNAKSKNGRLLPTGSSW